MATTPTKFEIEAHAPLPGIAAPSWLFGRNNSTGQETVFDSSTTRPSGRDALQALLAFSAMHQQVRQRRALAARHNGFETIVRPPEFEAGEQFVLDEVLQLVAERAVAITGADGLAIALAENNEIVLRASAGTIKPDVGARIDRDSAFSGACFRTAQLIRCDDTETDDRVNREACRRLGARSMVAVPLCGRRRVIGLLEGFSAEPFGFNDSDLVSLELLAELVLGALKPDDEDRFAQSAEVAAAALSEATVARADAAAVLAAVNPPAEKVAEANLPPQGPVQPKVQPNITAELAPTLAKSAVLPEPPAPTIANPESAFAPVAVAEETPAPEVVIEPQASTSRHPGVLIVLVLVVVGVMVAGGIWWKLKNAQLGAAMVQRPQKIATKSSASTAKTPAEIAAAAVSPGANPSADAASPLPIPDMATSAALDVAPAPLGKLPRVTGVRHWSAADSSTVVLDLEDQVQYEAHRLSRPDRIYFDLHDTSLSADLMGKTIEVGDALVSRIRTAQPSPGLTRIVLETRGNSNFSVSLEPNPYRLVVKLQGTGVAPKASANLFPDASDARNQLPIVVPPPSREDLQFRAHVPKLRIVVDAGHGGWDLGTVGRRGLLEKDLVLEIAQRLGKLLQSRLGSEVILTRSDDNYVPLDERAGIANQAQADLFVSVHANYSDLPSARGVETYYTNFFSSPSAKDFESRNASKDDAGKNAVSASLTPVELHDRIEQSRRLAASVQRSLYGTLAVQNPGLRDRGVKEAGFVVLTETAMPGILAEVSFVSSPTDEQKLRNDGYREQIAEALYKGIARYAANSHGVKVASAAK